MDGAQAIAINKLVKLKSHPLSEKQNKINDEQLRAPCNVFLKAFHQASHESHRTLLSEVARNE